MSEAQPFIDALLEDTGDMAMLGIYADWLEERGLMPTACTTPAQRGSFAWYCRPGNGLSAMEQLEARLEATLGAPFIRRNEWECTVRWNLAINAQTSQAELYWYGNELSSQQRNALPAGLCFIAGEQARRTRGLAQQSPGQAGNMLYVNALNSSGHTATTEMISLLGIPGALRAGVDSNATDVNGKTALMHIAGTDYSWHRGCRLGDLLTYPGINANQRDREGRTALMLAVKSNDAAKVYALTHYPGIDVNATDGTGNNALMLAFSCDNTAILADLLATPGIDLYAKNDSGESAYTLALSSGSSKKRLMLAARTGDVNTLRQVLAEPGISINASYDDGDTLLMMAVRGGHTGTVRFLLEYPDLAINAGDRNGNTAVMHAVESGHPDIAQLLLEHPRTDVNARNKSGQTVLTWAAMRGNLGIVQALLARPGINVNAQHEDPAWMWPERWSGDTPLHCAVRAGHMDIAKALIAMPGIDINARNKKRETALMFAAARNDTGMLRMLLACPGIDVNAEDKHGAPAVDWSARFNYVDATHVLLQCPSVEVSKKWSGKALRRAARFGWVDMARLLLGYPDVGVNGRDKDGNTALMLAADAGQRIQNDVSELPPGNHYLDIAHALLEAPGLDLLKHEQGEKACGMTHDDSLRHAIREAIKKQRAARPEDDVTPDSLKNPSMKQEEAVKR